MQRVCFTMRIRPGREAEYERRHQQVWPELVATLTASGVRNYSLFRSGTTVIAYAECEPDGPTAFGQVSGTEIDRRWREWFADVLAPEAGGGPDRLVPVWHLD